MDRRTCGFGWHNTKKRGCGLPIHAADTGRQRCTIGTGAFLISDPNAAVHFAMQLTRSSGMHVHFYCIIAGEGGSEAEEDCMGHSFTSTPFEP